MTISRVRQKTQGESDSAIGRGNVYANVQVCKFASVLANTNVCQFFGVRTRLMAIGTLDSVHGVIPRRGILWKLWILREEKQGRIHGTRCA